MKKVKILLPAICVVLCLAALSVPQLFFSAQADGGEYSVQSFTGLPSNWELSELCDVPNVSTMYRNDEMIIKSTSTLNQEKYYGAMYLIAKDRTYGDFTFEMKFKMDDPADANRWMGVMYRTKYADNGNLTGYLMNFRASGASAASGVSSTPTFYDEQQVVTGIPLSDGKFHKLTIVMQGSTAWHYMDDNLVTEFDTTVKNGILGGAIASGGFALIVNRSTVTVKNVSISPEPKKPAASTLERDTALATPYHHESALVGSPTLVCDVTDKSVLDDITTRVEKPQSAILRFDRDCNVTGKSGEVLGTFTDVYRSLDKKIIPVVYLADAASADAFITYTEKTLYILDIAVMSDDPSIVKRVRGELTHARGIVEYTSFTDLYDVVKTATEAMAMTVVLQQKDATAANVNYLQARFKTVWVREDGTGIGDAYESINSGAYGIVSRDCARVYEALDSYSAGYTRNIFNVAHRGLASKFNENSLGAIEGAIRGGATHLELDGHLTRDKHIVLNHNDSIDNVTNGSGAINDLTLEQIKSYDLIMREPHEKIPTLEEAIDLINSLNAELGADVVLVFEIKDDSADFVENMKRVLDAKQFYENIVVITFNKNEHQLTTLKALVPQIPTANLDGYSHDSLAAALSSLNSLNTCIDNILLNRSAAFDADLIDRGFTGWYWTYEYMTDVFNAAKSGVLGVTNNSPDCFASQTRFVSGTDVADATAETVPAVGDELKLTATLYNGKTKSLTATVYHVDETDKGWRVFCACADYANGAPRTVYAQAINYFAAQSETPTPTPTPTPPPATDVEPSSNLPLILGTTIPCGAIVIAAAIAIPLILKKRKAK